MAILRRVDGVQFAVQPYRAVLDVKKSVLLNQEVHLLAQDHGNFVRLFRISHEHYSAVFSQDPGFLLGETVWQHFDRPDNLIYCELMDDKIHALLVVINADGVVVDNKFELVNIIAELNSLILENTKYAVFTYGKVPITSSNDEKAYKFHEQNILSFNHLAEPLFTSLHVTDQFQLLPLHLALKEHHLNKSYNLPIIFTILLIIIAVSAWLLLSYIQ